MQASLFTGLAFEGAKVEKKSESEEVKTILI
jgi:hypothetical protein